MFKHTKMALNLGCDAPSGMTPHCMHTFICGEVDKNAKAAYAYELCPLLKHICAFNPKILTLKSEQTKWLNDQEQRTSQVPSYPILPIKHHYYPNPPFRRRKRHRPSPNSPPPLPALPHLHLRPNPHARPLLPPLSTQYLQQQNRPLPSLQHLILGLPTRRLPRRSPCFQRQNRHRVPHRRHRGAEMASVPI